MFLQLSILNTPNSCQTFKSRPPDAAPPEAAAGAFAHLAADHRRQARRDKRKSRPALRGRDERPRRDPRRVSAGGDKDGAPGDERLKADDAFTQVRYNIRSAAQSMATTRLRSFFLLERIVFHR